MSSPRSQQEADEEAIRYMALNLERQRRDVTAAIEYVDAALKRDPRVEIEDALGAAKRILKEAERESATDVREAHKSLEDIKNDD